MREIGVCKSVSKASIELISDSNKLLCAFLGKFFQFSINRFCAIKRKNRNVRQILSIVANKILTVNEQFDLVLKVRERNPKLYTDFLYSYWAVICRE